MIVHLPIDPDQGVCRISADGHTELTISLRQHWIDIEAIFPIVNKQKYLQKMLESRSEDALELLVKLDC